MLLSLSVIFSTALFLYLLCRWHIESSPKAVVLSKHSFIISPPLILAVLLFGLVCGVRYNFGVDNLSYINGYLYCQAFGEPKHDSEPLFVGIELLFANAGLHYSFFNGFWAIIQITFVFLAIRKEAYLLPFVVLFIVLGDTMLHWTNGLRQCVVTCIFIYLIKYIESRNFLKYAIGLILCSMIHKSAVILLPCYFLFRFRLVPANRIVAIGILLFMVILGSTPTWIHVMENLSGVLSFLEYDKYSNLETIISETQESIAWGPRRIGVFLMSVLSIWYFPKAVSFLHLGERYKIYYSAFFIGVCLFNLLANTSHIFLRPVYYFKDFQIIVVPVCLYFLYLKRDWRFALLALTAFFYTPLSTYIAFASGAGLSSPDVYKFFFLQ